jgi:calcium/calmodulin-dependent protein kinase I
MYPVSLSLAFVAATPGRQADRLYLVLEYMEGGVLYQVLSNKSVVYTEESASHILKDILEGLVYLHERGIVHRDIKPENILLDVSPSPDKVGTAKLADFGLSNFLGPGTGVLESRVGSPYFCAREVITSEAYGCKCDCWRYSS